MKFEYAFLFAVILLPICLAAQTTSPATGTIRGKVTDKKTAEPLIGASVVIVGIDKVASTDIYGTYSIDSIPNGTYTLMASYIGYKNTVKKAVKVRHGKTTRARFALKEETYQTEIIIPCERKYCANVVNDITEFPVVLFRDTTSIREIFEAWQRIAMYSDPYMPHKSPDQGFCVNCVTKKPFENLWIVGMTTSNIIYPLHPVRHSAEYNPEYGFLVSEPIFLPIPSLRRMVDMPCDEPSTRESAYYSFGYNNGVQRTVLISAFIIYDPFTAWSHSGTKPDIVL